MPEITTTLTPAEFRAALKRYALDWHESRLLAGMRERGVTALRYEALGNEAFRISEHGFLGAVARPLSKRYTAPCTCTGVVKPGPEGGSTVRYRVHVSPSVYRIPIYGALGGGVAICLVAYRFTGSSDALFGIVLAALVGTVGLAMNWVIGQGTLPKAERDFTELLARLGERAHAGGAASPGR